MNVDLREQAAKRSCEAGAVSQLRTQRTRGQQVPHRLTADSEGQRFRWKEKNLKGGETIDDECGGGGEFGGAGKREDGEEAGVGTGAGVVAAGAAGGGGCAEGCGASGADHDSSCGGGG